jgi:hypothetical protein
MHATEGASACNPKPKNLRQGERSPIACDTKLPILSERTTRDIQHQTSSRLLGIASDQVDRTERVQDPLIEYVTYQRAALRVDSAGTENGLHLARGLDKSHPRIHIDLAVDCAPGRKWRFSGSLRFALE